MNRRSTYRSCFAVVAASMAASAGAQAQSSPSDGVAGITGPDLTISTLDNFTKFGTVAGISAYSFLFEACNVGAAPASYLNCNISGGSCNQHPVNGQNVYRLQDGRFEQIGQKWVFHGVCGLDGLSARCSTACQQDSSCDTVGIGCTATHSSGVTADQASLGAKSEVNPWTGEFPFPNLLGGQQTGDAIYKRLQVRDADLTPNPNPNAGIRYFAEGQEICPDEAPQNRLNNVTYRQAIVTGTIASPSLAFSSPAAVPHLPAIMAWRAIDPTVAIATASAADDGLFYLASKVTDLGGGQWSYEYALYNMNSNRAAASFSVPVGAGTPIFNIGFHDVPYHSGEVYTDDDWSAAVSGGEIRWQTDEYALNPNANALRWGTLYNFRFISTAPPHDATVTVGLFRPGIGTTLSIVASAPMAICGGALRGDANCDGSVDNFDIDPFVEALVNNAAYLANAEWCGNNCNVDVDRDGSLTNFDIDPFVTCLISGCP